MNPQRFVLKRRPGTNHFEDPGHHVGVSTALSVGDEIEVVITPRKSVRERRAEVLRVLVANVRECHEEGWNHEGAIVEATERLEAIDRGDQ